MLSKAEEFLLPWEKETGFNYLLPIADFQSSLIIKQPFPYKNLSLNDL